MPTQRQLILVFLLPLFQICVAQKRQPYLLDSLATKSAAYLGNAVAANATDSLLVRLYSNAWLAKAKEEKNNKQLTLAYRHFALTVSKAMKLKYADSMLTAAKQTKEDLLLGKAYLTKGIIQYDLKNLRKALDNYLLADKYISATDDEASKYMVKYTIGLTKYHLGFYEEAIALFTECLKYYIHENDHAYLNTLHSLGICYNRTGRFDKCSEHNGGN